MDTCKIGIRDACSTAFIFNSAPTPFGGSHHDHDQENWENWSDVEKWSRFKLSKSFQQNQSRRAFDLWSAEWNLFGRRSGGQGWGGQETKILGLKRSEIQFSCCQSSRKNTQDWRKARKGVWVHLHFYLFDHLEVKWKKSKSHSKQVLPRLASLPQDPWMARLIKIRKYADPSCQVIIKYVTNARFN